MKYTDALKACIDGEKVRCNDWENKDCYIFFDTNFKIYEDNENYIISLVWLNDYTNSNWEICKPEPKFKVGQFVIYNNLAYVRVIHIDYKDHQYHYTIIGNKDSSVGAIIKESELSEVDEIDT